MKLCSRCVHQVKMYVFEILVKKEIVWLLSEVKFEKDKKVHLFQSAIACVIYCYYSNFSVLCSENMTFNF